MGSTTAEVVALARATRSQDRLERSDRVVDMDEVASGRQIADSEGRFLSTLGHGSQLTGERRQGEGPCLSRTDEIEEPNDHATCAQHESLHRRLG